MTEKPRALLPVAIILMGVSGSGKSTVAEALARRTGFAIEDADAFHPQANIDKMHAGTPLTDDDRWPWLRAIADAIDRKAETGWPVIIACSALKRSYRDVLVHGRSDVQIVYLRGTRNLIAARLAGRHGHFMPASLLDSQLAALEEPTPDEPVVTVDIDADVEIIVTNIIDRLALANAIKERSR
ncbi:gluconokinase [Bradyrhizobium prioriisuperbiae]|uniref:gluconokinase n=1 Tax=Bradyrhizobium prioriisuperbiae TaxID=2854389 RepID=UPI0028EDB17D|nr:gluconokinase [Bradyrhizobium prioritasuperba]